MMLQVSALLKCSRCHERRAFPFSGFPSLALQRNVSWLTVGVWGADICAAIIPISEYLHCQLTNSQHPQFQRGPAAPHLPCPLQCCSTSHALWGAHRFTLTLPKSSGKMHQFEPLPWISPPAAQGQRDAQCLTDGWMVIVISGCFWSQDHLQTRTKLSEPIFPSGSAHLLDGRKPPGTPHLFQTRMWNPLERSGQKRGAGDICTSAVVLCSYTSCAFDLSSCQLTLIFPLIYNSQDWI